MNKLLLALSFSYAALASNICVGPSSSGTGAGTDWNNKSQWSTLSFTRGNVYFLEDGTYAAKSLSTANSGTTTITVKKATVADHATDTGWSDTMGDGAAAMGTITTTTSYWIVDGNRGTTPWDACNPGSFGITIAVSNGGDGVDVQNANTGNQFINIDINGPGFRSTTSETHSFNVSHGGDPLVQSLLISKCRCQNMDTMIKCDNWSNCTVEYTTLRYCSSGNLASVHPDTFYFYPSVNVVIRYCFVGDVDSESIFFDFGGSDGIEIYGCVMAQGTGSDCSAIELKQGFTWGVFKLYNNVFDGWGKGVVYRANAGSGSLTKNNIFYNCDNTTAGATSDYNGYVGVTAAGTHTTTSAVNPFVNRSTLNYRLNSSTWPIDAGTSLGSPYNVDTDGNSRGSGAAWDLGAFEFASASSIAYSSSATGNFTFNGSGVIK